MRPQRKLSRRSMEQQCEAFNARHKIGDDREANCPRCKGEIDPRSPADRWERAYGPIRRGEAHYGPDGRFMKRLLSATR